MSAPPELSGVAASNLKVMKERLLDAQFPGEIEELTELEQAIAVTERAVNVNKTEMLKEVGLIAERFSQLADQALRDVDAADAAEFSAIKSGIEEATIDTHSLAERIKSLPYSERSKFIDLAINKNADELINGKGAST
jgi:hypothetical protein